MPIRAQLVRTTSDNIHSAAIISIRALRLGRRFSLLPRVGYPATTLGWERNFPSSSSRIRSSSRRRAAATPSRTSASAFILRQPSLHFGLLGMQRSACTFPHQVPFGITKARQISRRCQDGRKHATVGQIFDDKINPAFMLADVAADFLRQAHVRNPRTGSNQWQTFDTGDGSQRRRWAGAMTHHSAT